jgi:hypothetical protein
MDISIASKIWRFMLGGLRLEIMMVVLIIAIAWTYLI